MKVTMYVAPNGYKKTVEISNVLDEDRKFFESNSVVISMEEIPSNKGVDLVVYADTGMENEDGDPVEYMEIAGGRSCEEVLHKLRLSCEEYFKQKGEQQKKVAQEIYKKLKTIDPYALLAGGAPRDWYFGNLANDLDFYFFSTGFTVSAVTRQLSSIMGVKVEAVPYDKESHEHGQYKSMAFLQRVLEAEIEGEKVQFMQLTEPNAQFKVVDAMDVSICKAWCREDMSVHMHQDFKLTLASQIMFLSDGYNWSDRHPQKIADRFPKFQRSTKDAAVQKIVKNTIDGVGQ